VTEKEIVILANSVKRLPHRCVVGREVLRSSVGISLGRWVRPVSRKNEGPLDSSERTYADGSEPELFEIARVGLDSSAGSATHPENWYLGPLRWEKQGVIPSQLRHKIEEQPSDLWLAPEDRTDRINALRLGRLQRGSSVCVIRPEGLYLTSGRDSGGRPDRRANFKYRGVGYRLAVTDPGIESSFTPYPPKGHTRIVQLEGAEEILLCISLAALFTDGCHYKLVASIIRP
jgi:hypothetical protein